MENNFKKLFNHTYNSDLYSCYIPLFEGMLLYFKAKKTIFIYLSPVKLKVNVLNFILNFVLIFQLLTEINR